MSKLVVLTVLLLESWSRPVTSQLRGINPERADPPETNITTTNVEQQQRQNEEEVEDSVSKISTRKSRMSRHHRALVVDNPDPKKTSFMLEMKRIRPHVVDNLALEEEDDPVVVLNVGLSSDDIQGGFNSENPLFDLSSVPAEEKAMLVAHKLASLLPGKVTVEQTLPSIMVGTIEVPASAVATVMAADGVLFAERDSYVHEDGNAYAFGETIAESIKIVNGNTYSDFPYPRQATAECSNPNAFRVAVVDGGVDCGHWDFEYCGINFVTGNPIPDRPVRCMGSEFLPPASAQAGQNWFNSQRGHGVHVTGLVGASGVNGRGVAGMIPDEDFCLMTVRVFDNNGGAVLSKLVSGIVWAVDNGAKVINMSLGTSKDSDILRQAIQYAKSKGVILVGSAGNKNNADPNYPAAYPEVLGVTSINMYNQKSWFSSWGRTNVNIAAPGENVLSTAPRENEAPLTIIKQRGVGGGAEFEGNLMIYSRYIGRVGLLGLMVDCQVGSDGVADCMGGSGNHTCLFEISATVSFHTMAEQCYQSRGIAAIISNDENEPLLGTMGVSAGSSESLTVPIPVVGVSMSVGTELKSRVGKVFELANPLETDSLTNGYERRSGTSMAAPQVAGAAAYIWRQCPACSSNDVEACLTSTALNLGNTEVFGSGLLQTDMAFHCMINLECCPGGLSNAPSTVQTQNGYVSPSKSPLLQSSAIPTAPRSRTPSQKPSTSPSRRPSRFPSSFPTLGPSKSPTPRPTSCQTSCDNQYAFCTFRVDAICNVNSCENLCRAAVSSGTLPPQSIGTCTAVWCQEEIATCNDSAVAKCDTDKASCEANCGA